MEPLQCSTPPLSPSRPSPKSPPQMPISPRNSPPPQDREKSASPPNDRQPSPEPNCAICLGKSQNKSFTDSCLHQFCFTCLLEWSRVKAECPLCKQSFKSIIHNVRSNEDYDQYHLRQADQRLQNPWVDPQAQRFRYSTTLTAERRLERALQDLEHDLQRRFEAGDIIPPQRSWLGRRGLQPVDFRINVYTRNLWIRSLPSFGAVRPISPEHFRSNPEEVHRLIPWLNRELQAILRSPGLSTRVLDLVVTQLPCNHMCSTEFRNAIEPYLREHYDHFIHEFQQFARSPYDMIGFDENANYSNRSDSMVEVVHEVSDSSDSDVIVLPSDENRAHIRHIATSTSPTPGASRPFVPIDQASDSDSSSTEVSTQDAETQVGGGPNSDDCMIVGYVKPRHERTPEIITLLSDTEVEEDVTELPDMSQMIENYTFSTTSSSDDSDSDYVPNAIRKPQKKVQSRKKPVASSSKKKSSGRKSSSSHSKRRDYSSSDESQCSCLVRSVHRKPHSISSSSSSSSSSSECGNSYRKRYRKGSWRVKINLPDSRRDCSYDPPYTTSEINTYLASSSCTNGSASRPKLRSIVITRKPNSENKVRELPSEDLSRSSKKGNKKVKSEVKSEPSTSASTSRHRGSSHSSHSSRHRESSNSSSRHKHSKKEDKKRHRKDSDDHKSRSSKTKKRKRILSIYSDSSD